MLIDPNPESALNDEAGRLLLEAYDDFAQRARMMTDLYAGKRGDADCDSDCKGAAAAGTGASAPKKRATDKKKSDRKKSLKRL